MIKLQLKDGKEITCVSKDDLFIACSCAGIQCHQCPFGMHCGREFDAMTFGEAMEQRKEKIEEMVEEIIECDAKGEEQEELKKIYAFELTDEQAMYLHAFMNMWETDAIQDTLDVMEFFDADNPPFIRRDMNNIPKEWYDDNRYHIVNIMHAISCEIFNKLNAQRELD